MPSELKPLAHFFLQNLALNLTPLSSDTEATAYSGYTCQLADVVLKFRKAKVTPKKIGQFVTLWQRNAAGITMPFRETDPFDFYLIATHHHDQVGFFFFPKQVLVDKHILATTSKDGKRGFRVYPTWDTPTSKQALQTQEWQQQYFIDCTAHLPQAQEKIKRLLQQR